MGTLGARLLKSLQRCSVRLETMGNIETRGEPPKLLFQFGAGRRRIGNSRGSFAPVARSLWLRDVIVDVIELVLEGAFPKHIREFEYFSDTMKHRPTAADVLHLRKSKILEPTQLEIDGR